MRVWEGGGAGWGWGGSGGAGGYRCVHVGGWVPGGAAAEGRATGAGVGGWVRGQRWSGGLQVRAWLRVCGAVVERRAGKSRAQEACWAEDLAAGMVTHCASCVRAALLFVVCC